MSLNVTASRTLSAGDDTTVDVRWSSYLYSTPRHAIVDVHCYDPWSTQDWVCFLPDSSASGLRLLDAAWLASVVPSTVTVKGCTGPTTVVGLFVDCFPVDASGSTSIGPAASNGPEDPKDAVDRAAIYLGSLHLKPASSASASASAAQELPVTSLDRLQAGTFFGASCPNAVNPVLQVEREDHRKATVVWSMPYTPYGQTTLDKMLLELSVVSSFGDAVRSTGNVYIANSDSCRSINRFDFPDALQTGQRYRVTAKALVTSRRPVPLPPRYVDSFRVVGQATVEFLAVLTTTELGKLHQRALTNTYSSTTCLVLYRNKSPDYFARMFNHDGGVMKVYAKDPSGDPASPINGQISGLFFMAEVEPGTHGEPYHASAFGSTRLIVPVRALLDLAPNIYFSDFYCMRGKFHYVTLVATRTGSDADNFCREHLLPLSLSDRVNNKFLFEDVDGQMKVAVGIKVEILVTENIDVNYMKTYKGAVIRENVPLIGKGSSTPGGLRKNPSCTVCNLYPVGSLFGARSRYTSFSGFVRDFDFFD